MEEKRCPESCEGARCLTLLSGGGSGRPGAAAGRLLRALARSPRAAARRLRRSRRRFRCLRGAPLVAAGGEGAWAALPSPEARAGRPGPMCEGGRGCGQPAASHTADGGLWEVHRAVKPPAVSHSCSVKPLRAWLMLLTRNRMLFFF